MAFSLFKIKTHDDKQINTYAHKHTYIQTYLLLKETEVLAALNKRSVTLAKCTGFGTWLLFTLHRDNL